MSADPATGVVRTIPDQVGVSRATRFTGGAEVGSPWSPPVQVRVLAPFDGPSNIEFIDRRGPSYRIRPAVKEKSTRGRVSIALARGSKGGKYRSLGSVKPTSQATITKRFRASVGTYRLRLKDTGQGNTAGGLPIYKLRFTRSISFG